MGLRAARTERPASKDERAKTKYDWPCGRDRQPPRDKVHRADVAEPCPLLRNGKDGREGLCEVAAGPSRA